MIEKELQPLGVDATVAAERLASFHRVENTYLSTFQALGGLGLLLGTIGLATVMFRNVLERRRELGLLRAVGYDRARMTVMIVAEAVFLLAVGMIAGVGCAAIAIAPAWLEEAEHCREPACCCCSPRLSWPASCRRRLRRGRRSGEGCSTHCGRSKQSTTFAVIRSSRPQARGPARRLRRSS